MRKYNKDTVLEGIDVFSKSFEFTFGGKDKFKSTMGGYFTILTVFVIIYITWILGKEIIQHDVPKDYAVLGLKEQPANLTLIVPTGFMIQDNRGRIITDYDRLITFEAFYWNKTRVNGTFVDAAPPKPLKIRECSSSDFSDEVYSSFVTLQMDSAKCLDEREQVLGGDYTGDFVKFVSVRITPCFNTTERDYCAPFDESFNYLNVKNLVVSLKSEKILYSSIDYAKPVTKIINENTILIDPYIFNFPTYQMYEFIVETDNGLIGQSKYSESFYEYYFLNDIITAFDNEGNIPTHGSKLLLYEYTFFESSTVKTQIRSYLKLTDVLASLGGLLKCYYIVFNFFFHKIYERIMYEQVITQLFNFEKVSHTLETRKRKGFSSTGSKLHGGVSGVSGTVISKPGINVTITEKNEIENKTDNDLKYKGEKETEQNKLETDKVSELGNATGNATGKPFKRFTIFNNNFLQRADGNSENSSNLPNPRCASSVLKKINSKIENKTDLDNKSDMFSSGAMSAFFSKKKMRQARRNKKIFSLTDHIILSFLPCCNMCSSKLREVDEQFKKLIQYMYKYIDVLQMMRQFHELQLLKFVLFNKKQLAIFENIGMPEDPFSKNKFSKINELNYFQQNAKEQKVKAKEFFSGDNGLNDSKISKRLKKLYLN
jgi:hypothetical protein